MKTVSAKDIRDAVAAMCIAANRELPADVRSSFEAAHAAIAQGVQQWVRRIRLIA